MNTIKHLILQMNIVGITLLLLRLPLSAQENTAAVQNDAVVPKQESRQTENEKNETSEAREEGNIFKLNQIVVTATKTKEKLKDVPVHVDIITSKDIEALGQNTLGDAIGQTITGHYHRYSGSSQAAGLTGNLAADSMGDSTHDRVIVLVDGHRLGTGNLGKIPPEIIDRVEVIKGPASAIYGSNAMGGVINIITKKGNGNISNTVKLETGSFDYLRNAVTSGGLINDLSNYFFTGSYMKIGDYQTKNYGTAYNSNGEQAHFWGNLSFYPAAEQSLRLGFSYSDIKSHYPEWNNYTQHTYYNTTTKAYSDISRGHSDLEYNLGLLQNKFNWKAIAYFLWDRRSWFTATSGKVEDDAAVYNDYTTGTDQQFEISLIPLNKILFGYSFELLKRNAKNKEAGVKTTNPTPAFNYYTNSMYVQDTVSILNKTLLFIIGARYDRFDLDTDNSSANSKDVSYDNISPRGGLVYKISDILRLRGNIGRGFRAPNADELTIEIDTHGYGIWKGNPNLKPETSMTYDAGFDLFPGDVNIGATYSYIKTKNFITYVPTSSSINEYKNVESADMEIIDCYIKWSAGKTFALPVGLDLTSNVTFNTKYKDNNTGDKLPFVPDREIKSSIQTIYKSLAVTLSHVYVGHENLHNGDRKESFYFINLTSSYELSSNISAQVAVFNLTDKDYEWVRGYPMPERNYKIGLTGKF